MHRLLYCSSKSCAQFKISFERWFVVELFICPEERGRGGWVTIVLPDSFCSSSPLNCWNMFLMVLHCYVVFFFLITVQTQVFYSDKRCQRISSIWESNQICVIGCLLCSSGKIVDYTWNDRLNTLIHWNKKDGVTISRLKHILKHCFKMKIRIKEICTMYT